MQNLVRCLSMIGVVGFLLIGFHLPVVGQSSSQSQSGMNPANRPMTLPQFELYLQNRTPPRRLADEIRRRGVDFTVDLRFIDSLRNRGVGAEVIESLIAFVDDAAIYGTLAVSAAQSQVSIQVDGIGVFQQSMNQQVPEGSYLVTVTAPGFVTRKYRVGVKAGQVTNLVPKMASVIDLNQLM
ncbi:MAG TPA: carboxypeptidase-like regulatory domain-containing protein, partial [Acidobacteriota bacterium]|nr:carboxypeptidase-like regulatory domain-containing protein [Acidobacteriota bacterium]